MTAPDDILRLIDQFHSQLASYRSKEYNEAQARNEFVEPFFLALGWDVYNQEGNAYAYKDVIYEDSIKVAGATKAPDYAFRIGGTRKFFVEAKKPSVSIKDEITPAYQLRRYAWSAKLPLSILTDFEEFAVYDCRTKPNKTDKASTGRIMFLTYCDYSSHWDEIASVFSRDAVRKGSFDKYAEAVTGKHGTAEVDDAFLAEIERWRDLLAHNIALRNPTLSQRDLNYAVQMTIDRLIFLRICEARGIEFYGQLQSLLNGGETYPRLCQLFRKADERYNSGLFHFLPERDQADSPDMLTPGLLLDDKPLKDILANLYYPESPYEFSVLPADILGQVYERFLGKVIRLTSGHRAVVEDKPEVKKAGGVFYTPTFIVDYIVKNTLGKLLEGKSPGQVGVGKGTPLRVLDMSCGSGSFLIGAYQYLLDWYLSGYSLESEKWSKGTSPKLYQVSSRDGVQWNLTTSERKRILLDHIYGVDIDSQAVEVTKLSLLLKVLEGESQESIGKQLSMFRQRALPDLSCNIKCGNSLIGPDFYTQQNRQITMFNTEDMYHINAFDWNAEFPEIMKEGGFDAVIGNPPWGAEFSDNELEYYRKLNKEIIVRMIDSFIYFVHQGSKKLLGNNAYFGMILPDVVLYQNDNIKLRNYIIKKFQLQTIVNMGNVFDKVTRPACILVFKRGGVLHQPISILDISKQRKNKSGLLFNSGLFGQIYQNDLLPIPGLLFVTENIESYKIWSKVNFVPNTVLGDVIDIDGIQRGVSPDLKEAFIVNRETVEHFNLEPQKIRRVLTGGRQVKRYYIDYKELFLIYTTRYDDFRQVPNICKFIDQYKDRITCKEVNENKHPLYALHRPRNEQIFKKENKFIGVITEDEIVVALDNMGIYATDGLYLFDTQDWMNKKYLLGILNSKLFVFIYRLLTLEKDRVLAQVKPTILQTLPIRTINLEDQSDILLHEKIVSLVNMMIDLNKSLGKALTPTEMNILIRQIETTNKQIDSLVYELYDLTDEEIGLVEGM